MEEVLGVICDVCGSGIRYPICFQLNPCQHRACARCFHQFLPAGVFHRCPCKDCHEWIASSTLLELHQGSSAAEPTTPTKHRTDEGIPLLRRRNLADASLLRQVQEVPHFQPDEQMDPFRYWAIQKPSLYTGLIYVAYRSTKDQATFYKSSFQAYDSTVFMDDESSDEMVKIFARILHPLLFQQKGNKTPKPNRGETSSSSPPQSPPPRLSDPVHRKTTSYLPDSLLCDHYDRKDRQHLAMRCMYALSSGRILTRQEQEENFGGTRENLKLQGNSNDQPALANTQQLARELLKAYQLSCMTGKQQKKTTSTKPSLPQAPTPIVHDLRPQQEKDSKDPQQKASSAFQEGPHWIPPDDSDDEGTKENTTTNHSLSESERAWANELGLHGNEDEVKNNDIENPFGVVPAILWILSTVFVLSKK